MLEAGIQRNSPATDSDVAPRIDFGLTAVPHNLLLFKAKPQVPPGAATKASVTCPYGQLIGE